MQGRMRVLRELISAAIIAAAVLLLLAINVKAIAARKLPSAERSVVRIATQAEGYPVFKEAGLWGAHVVHFGQHFYLMPYFPYERTNPVPFPIETHDIRPLYEQGLDSHSWLFIANRNGLVRRVTAVIPDSNFKEKVDAFKSDFSFRAYRGGYRGYLYGMPREVFPISDFVCPVGPVVVKVDAGVFIDGIRPETLASAIQQQCTDIRMIVLVDSTDDPEVTDGMRKSLDTFQGLVARTAI